MTGEWPQETGQRLGYDRVSLKEWEQSRLGRANQVEKTRTRSRAIERKLRNVEGVPAGEVRVLLGASEAEAEPAGAEDEEPGRDESGGG